MMENPSFDRLADVFNKQMEVT